MWTLVRLLVVSTLAIIIFLLIAEHGCDWVLQHTHEHLSFIQDNPL